MIQTLQIALPILLLVLQTSQSDDLKNSLIFDDRLGSRQEIKNTFETQQRNLESKKEAKDEDDKITTEQSNLSYIKRILSKFLSTLKRNKRNLKDTGDKQNIERDKRKETTTNKPKWHKWTDWSTCSVTCGKGRVIRWRHCQENCDGIETEMEEMACQLPQCPRSLFGMIKLKR